MNPEVLPFIITIASWLAVSPVHQAGLFVNYGSQELIEANAEYRGYDLGLYPERCGLSAISPLDLGTIYWVRVGDTEWTGPCLAVDVGARVDFADQIERGEVAELPDWLMVRFGVWFSTWGEVYKGSCPPLAYARRVGVPFKPRLDYAPNMGAIYVPHPPQQKPVKCETKSP